MSNSELIAKALQKREGTSPAITTSAPESQDYGVMDFLRQVSRGTYKGGTGIATLIPEALMSGGKASTIGLGVIAGNPALGKRLHDAHPYEYGAIMNKAQDVLHKHVLDPYLPSKPQDKPFIEPFAEVAIPGLGVLGVANKFVRAAKAAGKTAPLLARLFGSNVPAEVAGITGSSTAVGAADALDAPPTYQALAALVGGILPSTTVRGIQQSRQLLQKGLEESPEVIKKLKDVAAKTGKAIPEKAQEASEVMAMQRLKKAAGGTDDDLLRLLSEIDSTTSKEVGQTLAERVGDPRLLGYEEHLTKTLPEAAQARATTDISRNVVRREVISGMAPPIDDAASKIPQAVKKGEKTAREAASLPFQTLDPEKTSRIPILEAKKQVYGTVKELKRKGVEGLTGKDKSLVVDFLAEQREVPIQKLQQYASEAGQLEEVARIAGRNQDAAIMRKIKESALQAGDDAADLGFGLHQAEAQQWKQARSGYREYAQTYREGLTKKALDTDSPSLLGRDILKQPKEEVQRIVKATPVEDLPILRRAVIDEVLEKSRQPGTSLVAPTKLAERVRETVDKTGDLFEPEHRKAMQEVFDMIDSQKQSRQLGRAAAGAHKPGAVKGMFEHFKDMMQSRMGWKYPMQRKVIQLLSQNGKLQQVSLDDLVNQETIKLMHDPDYAKLMIQKATSAESKALFNKGLGKNIVDRSVEGVKNTLKDAKNFVPEQLGRRVPGAAGVLAAESYSPEEELTDFIRSTNSPAQEPMQEQSNTTANIIARALERKLAAGNTPEPQGFAEPMSMRTSESVDVIERIKADPVDHAIMLTESSGNPNAKNNEKPGNSASGLFQLVGETAKGLGVNDVFDPAQNYEGYLKLKNKTIENYGSSPEIIYAGHFLGETTLRKWLNGEELNKNQRQWVRDFETKALPRFQRIYNNLPSGVA